MEDQAFDFGQIKAAHDALMREYARVLLDEAGRKNRTVQALVESHIREKLLQLEKLYTLLGFHHRSVDAAFSGWLAAQAADCGTIAAKLTTLNQFFARPVKIAGGILAFVTSMFLIIIYGKLVTLPEAISQWEVLAKAINQYLPFVYLFFNSLFLLVFFFSNFILSKASYIKRTLFGAPDMKYKNQKHSVSNPDIYGLENQLYFLLQRNKTPEIPFDIFEMPGFFILTAILYLIIVAVRPALGSVSLLIILLLTILISTIMLLYNFLKRRKYY